MESNLRFLVLSILSQASALILSSILLDPLSSSVFVRIFFPTLLIFIFGHFIKFPAGWQISNLFIPLALFLSATGSVPSYVFLLLALCIAAFHLPAVWSRVPYYPTPREVYEAISNVIPGDTSSKFLDIGCGMGGLLVYLANRHPNAIVEGVEISLAPYIVSKLKSLFYPNLYVRYCSFWEIDFSGYDLVYAFLSPAPMSKIRVKLKNQFPNLAFISNSFPITEMSGQELVVSPLKGGVLYIYRKLPGR